MELIKSCFLGDRSNTQDINDPDETSIRMYLDANPGFLAEYIADEVTARDLEDWLHMKRRVDGTSPDSAHSYVVTSCASSNKFKTCTGYTAREHGSSSSSVEEEDVPSVIMMSVHQEKKRHSFVVLNEKQLMSKLYPFRSSSDDLSALDFQKEKPRTVDSTTMTSPPPRPKGKPGQSHSNGLLQPVYPDHRMDSSSLSDSFSSAISNGSPEVHSTNGLHQTRSNSNGLYSHGFRHAVSMNGHQANGHNLSNRNYKRQSSVNGHMHSNEPSRVLSANGSPRKPRRVLPVSASKTIRNMTV